MDKDGRIDANDRVDLVIIGVIVINANVCTFVSPLYT
jgi:hypothetical protein